MLEHFLVTQIFAFFLIFCRIGSGIMVLPGFGETYVPTRIRLCLALIITLLLVPVLNKIIPPLPASPMALFIMVLIEIVIGLLIGTVCKILISATNIAGTVLSTQIGLSSVVIFDVTQSSQGSALGNFLGLLVILLLFSTDLHYVMLEGVTQSYSVFLPGHFIPLHDFVEAETRLLSETFSVAIQISAPLIVAGTLLFLGAGILSRLSPTMQVFFIVTPAQLFLGMFVLMTSFSAIMIYYMDFFRDKLTGFMDYVQ